MGDIYQPNITLISSKKNKTKTNRIKVLSSTIAHSIHLCKKKNKKKKKCSHYAHTHTPRWFVRSFVRVVRWLFVPSSSTALNPKEREEKKRVFACLYVLAECVWMECPSVECQTWPSNRKENRENGSENERVNSLCSRLCVCVCVCLAVKQPKQNHVHAE